MALTKQPISINFSQGVDLKTDSKQVPIGKFLNLKNTVFGTNGMLKKRNGYELLSTLPQIPDYLTTLNGNLTGVGENIVAYSASQKTWLSKGTMTPIDLSTLPLIHNSVNHTQVDAATANGLICAVYTEVNNASSTYKYAIADATTGQNIVAPTPIPAGSGVVTGGLRVFTLGNYFVIGYTNLISGTSHLQYIAISVLDPTSVTTPADLAASYIPSAAVAWEGVVYSNSLYFAYNTTAGGQSIKVAKLSANAAAIGGAPTVATTYAGEIATNFAMAIDSSIAGSPILYVVYIDTVGNTQNIVALDQNLFTVLSPTAITMPTNTSNLAATAQNGSCQVYYEVDDVYGYGAGLPTHNIVTKNVTQAGVIDPAGITGTTVVRSVGLASKAVLIDGTTYFLAAYQSAYQSSYFLINGTSTAAAPKPLARLAYQNGGGYVTTGLPNLINNSGTLEVPFLIKDLITPANKGTDVPSGTQTAGVYAQTGIDYARFVLNTEDIYSSEIANNLHITGGFMWQYDGYLPVEHNFLIYPENIGATWSATGGSIAAQPDGATNTNAYYYQVTYEWSDNQGFIHRSAPSIPVAVTTTGSGTSGSIQINVPTLRLTYKISNPLKLVVYRWSVAQQAYYQVTSISAATINSTTTDAITITDTLADATILGNNLIYTTGGVVENIAAPAISATTLFDNRLWVINAENRNVLGYSKQVIQGTPVEMSDLFTLYIAPTTGVQGPGTGPSRAICGMDDKLIVFKDNAIYYINGSGPDITGANSQYSQPIFITSAVGCSNPDSVALIPTGVIFQSNKGIWLIDRGLNTTYIGAPVEAYNADVVQSAVVVPGTTQVRLRMASGVVLVYDYFYDQWGTFTGIPGISSVIYNDLDTFINKYGQVLQETPNRYLDNTTPVLLGFTTSWISLAGLQGFERFYHGYLLGSYYTPFKLNMQLAYDYNENATQLIEIVPDNFTVNYGDDVLYGSGSPYGGPGNVFEARFFPQVQKCETFQITMDEIYDPSMGVVAGQGLTLSGLNLIVGTKRGFRTQKSSQSFG